MIVYSKEYIAGTKVMRRNVYNDGTVKIEYVRDIEFKDTKKYPNLKLNIEPVELINSPKIAKEDKEYLEKQVESIKPDTLEDIKKIVDTLEVEKTEDKKKRKKKNEEVILPKPELLD